MLRKFALNLRSRLTILTNQLLQDTERARRQARFLEDQIGNFRKKNPLLGLPVCFFSQNDEDQILLSILERIEKHQRPSVFLELGVGNGLENNTIVLLAIGWSGVWVGGQELAFETADSRVTFQRAWVTNDNVSSLVADGLRKRGRSIADVDVASIDLDGNDFHFVKTLFADGLRPAILIVEYNAKFPPPIRFVMDYNPAHTWAWNDYFGASLSSWDDLLTSEGYRLVACNLNGANAFYIDQRYSEKFQDVPSDISQLFIPGTHVSLPRSGHSTSANMVRQLSR